MKIPELDAGVEGDSLQDVDGRMVAALRNMAEEIANTAQISYSCAADYTAKRNRYVEETLMPILRRHNPPIVRISNDAP